MGIQRLCLHLIWQLSLCLSRRSRSSLGLDFHIYGMKMVVVGGEETVICEMAQLDRHLPCGMDRENLSGVGASHPQQPLGTAAW